jgi:hypothetical protein
MEPKSQGEIAKLEALVERLAADLANVRKALETDGDALPSEPGKGA